jgi:hypothetical protein
MSVIITCAGTTLVNRVYDYNGTSFISRNGISSSPYISYSVDRWIIQDNVDQYYYLIESNNANNIIDNGVRTWVTMGGGTSPVPKVSSLEYSTCNTLIVFGSSESGANNGVYLLAYTEDPTPRPFYVNTVNATYTIEQISLDEGQREWALLGAGEVVYGSITVPDYTPPIGALIAGQGVGQGAGGSIDFSSSCSFLECNSEGGGETPSGSGSFFVYNNSGSFRLYRQYNSIYIRKA